MFMTLCVTSAVCLSVCAAGSGWFCAQCNSCGAARACCRLFWSCGNCFGMFTVLCISCRIMTGAVEIPCCVLWYYGGSEWCLVLLCRSSVVFCDAVEIPCCVVWYYGGSSANCRYRNHVEASQQDVCVTFAVFLLLNFLLSFLPLILFSFW